LHGSIRNVASRDKQGNAQKAVQNLHACGLRHDLGTPQNFKLYFKSWVKTLTERAIQQLQISLQLWIAFRVLTSGTAGTPADLFLFGKHAT
jgi:hypothetical protein